MRLLPTPATSMPSFAGVRLYPRTFAAARLGFLALLLGAFALGAALALGLRGEGSGRPGGPGLHCASVAAAGSDLWRPPAAGGEPRQVAHLSEGLSRDWDLSPDGA